MFSTTSAKILLLFIGIGFAIACMAVPIVHAQSGTDFPGTVLKVDSSAKKLTVKKDEGGTRFTFVVHDKTQFSGGLKGLDDLKTGERVIVNYVVKGSQYLAQTVTSVKKP